MKKRIIISFGTILLVAGSIIMIPTGCNEKYLEITPTASLNPSVLQSVEGLDAMLVAAYAALDGITTRPAGVGWEVDFTNWLYGEMSSDNALKGSSVTDQPNMNSIEQWGTLTSDNPFMKAVWAGVYEGVSRSNAVLQILAETEVLSDADKKRIAGEARFLRGHFHHYGRRYFGMIPYIDENVTDYRIPNNSDIAGEIEADYKFAIDNLPMNPKEIGRVHISAAQASLAKLYLDDGDYASAKPYLDAIINSGRYILFPNYNDNFIYSNENLITNTEKIFQFQSTGERIGGGTLDGRIIHGIAQLHGCCGFYQPSQNLVNAYKTDKNGLPLLDTYNDVDLANDQGIETSEAFAPPTDILDPRLDFTVARRGIPYLDFNIGILPGDANLFPGKKYIVDQPNYGPYRAKKFTVTKAEQDAGNPFVGASNINQSIHRYGEILLLRAEVAVEENDLSTALKYVNMVRNRAKSGEVIRFKDGTPAANYVIEPYPSFPNQDYARKAVRFERRLETALEGNRWYDLVRWGVAKEVMTKYFATEDRPLLTKFGAYKSDFLPIPGSEIDVTRDDNGNPTLTQNPDYN